MLPDLPLLALEVVCDHLSYDDLFMLRSVYKPLKQFVDGKQFTKLHLFIENYSYNRHLFYTDDPTGYVHSLHADTLAILDSNRFQMCFANVQLMTICRKKMPFQDHPIELDLNRLNCFAALRHLEVDEFHSLNGQLNLKELQIAAFERRESPGIGRARLGVRPFGLNCPKLRALKIRGCRPVLSEDTDQLDYLHYDYIGDGSTDFLERILRRISTICFKKIGCLLLFLDDLRTGRLSAPSLSELKLEQWNKAPKGLNKLAASLEDLQRLRETNGRTRRIQFILNGRPIGSPDELRQIASLIRAYDSKAEEMDRVNREEDHGTLGVRSISFLNEMPELCCLLSADWSVEIPEKLNEEIIARLKYIERLEFYGKYRPSFNIFEQFVRNCTVLQFWTFSNQVVTEQLLEMMSKHLVNLMWLRIDECRYETAKPVAKFRNLNFVNFDFNPGRDELTYVFENSRTLETIQIEGKDTISLSRGRNPTTGYQIFIYPCQSFYFESLSAMIDYYLQQNLFEKQEHASIRMRSCGVQFDDSVG